jgi:group II intron reverse transcriptase/maturase
MLRMLAHRIDDRAFLHLIRKWLKAGILETDGKVIHPDTGTPQGGIISPVLANIYLHYALDLWFERVVKRASEGEAFMVRYADDFVSAFRYQEDAERYYRALPKRLKRFGLEVATEKTGIVRFSRYHPGIPHRFSFLGFELYWGEDRQGRQKVVKRTARKRLQRAKRQMTEWIRASRHSMEKVFITGLNRRLVGHYNYYGLWSNERSLWSFYYTTIQTVYKWLNRRGGKRRSYEWATFATLLTEWGIAVPRITERRRQHPVFAWA